MIIKQSFPEYLIKSFLIGKVEKTFWGKEYVQFGVLTTLCSNFYEYSALLGILYAKDWKTFITAFNVPIGKENEIYSVAKTEIEKKLLPFAKDSTFFELLSKELEKSDKRYSLSSANSTKIYEEKFPAKEAFLLAAFNSLEGAFAGIIFPEAINQVYDNGSKQQQMLDKISEISKIDIKKQLGISDYQYPIFEKQQYDVNMLFLEYAEENLPESIFDKLLLLTYSEDSVDDY